MSDETETCASSPSNCLCTYNDLFLSLSLVFSLCLRHFHVRALISLLPIHVFLVSGGAFAVHTNQEHK